MGFNVPLDNDQYDLIHSDSYGSEWLIWLCQNTVLLHGTIDEDLDSDPTWLQFDYTAISGNWADVEPMMAILIGEENDIAKATYRGRITEAGVTADVININESGGTFPSGTYFWIVNTFDITYRAWKPSTLDPLTAEVLIDGTITYRAMQPKIKGTAAKPLRTAYVGTVDSVTNKMRIAFDVSSSQPVAPAASIASYQFTFKSGTYTVVSGSLSSAIVTVDINDNTEQWGKLVITDDDGNVSTRRFYISTLPPVVTFKPTARITSTLEQGWTMSIPAFADVDDVLNNTFAVCARTIEAFDGEDDTLYPDNNVMFLGWLQREADTLSADSSAGVLSSSTFEFTGVRARMARLVNQPFAFEQSSAPTRWGQISTLTPQKAIKAFLDNFSTVTWLCELDIDMSDTTFNFPDITTQGGNFMDAIKVMAEQISFLAEFAPDGRIGFFEDYTYQDATERSTIDTIADWEAKDAVKDGITKTQEENPSVGKVNGSGAFLYTTIQQVIAYTVAAPSLAQGESQETRTLPAQILASTDTPEDALTELEYRAGSLFNFVNNSLFLDVTHRSTIYGLIPSHSEFYTWTIDETTAGDNGIHRILYDTTTAWVCESITYTRSANGKTAVKARYHYVQPPGSKGVNTTPQPQNSAPNNLPDLGLPAFDFELPEVTFPDLGLLNINPLQLQPPPNKLAATDGNVVLAWNEDVACLLKSFIALTTPQAYNITPSDLDTFEIQAGLFDPLNIGSSKSTANRYGYLLSSESDDIVSKIYRAENIFSKPPQWTDGNEIHGLYNILRGTNDDGGLLAYRPRSDENDDTPPAGYDWQRTFYFADGAQGWYQFGGSTVHFTGTGMEGDCWFSGGERAIVIWTGITFPTSATLRYVSVDRTNTTNGSKHYGTVFQVAAGDLVDFGYVTGTHQVSTWSDGTGVVIGAGSFLNVSIGGSANFGPCPSGDVINYKIVLRGMGTNPFPATSEARVAYSPDRGASWDAPVVVGDSLATVGGFDVSRASETSYAACAAKVRKATTLGGAYSDFVAFTGANPVCVIIPYFRLGSTTTKQTTASDPDLIVALDQADSGGGTLYKVTGAGVKTDITPTAGMTFDNPNCITTLYGNKIAVFGLVSGAYKLYISQNTGTSWTLVGTVPNAHFIRTRRGDSRVQANKGQLFIAENGKIYYSSAWATNGIFPRNTSFIPLGFDPLG